MTLPAAVHYVRQRVKNTPPDKVLMPCLNNFTRRTTGAREMLITLIKATNESLERHEMQFRRVPQQHEPGVILGRRIAPAPSRLEEQGSHIPSDMNWAKIKEARVLACVTRALDNALELQC